MARASAGLVSAGGGTRQKGSASLPRRTLIDVELRAQPSLLGCACAARRQCWPVLCVERAPVSTTAPCAACAQEVSFLCGVRHPHVTRLHAACLCPPYMFIVEEPIPKTLSRLLHPEPEAPGMDSPPKQHLSLKQVSPPVQRL